MKLSEEFEKMAKHNYNFAKDEYYDFMRIYENMAKMAKRIEYLEEKLHVKDDSL